MASVTFKANRANYTKILNSPGVMSMVDGKAESIRATAASMYSATGYGKKPARAGRGSAHAVVYTGSNFARWENRQKMTLSKAMRMNGPFDTSKSS